MHMLAIYSISSSLTCIVSSLLPHFVRSIPLCTFLSSMVITKIDVNKPVNVVRDLGVILDQELFMYQHINKVALHLRTN